LWEGSWDDGAVVADREHDTYTDPAKVHYIDHEGTYFRVAGPHLSEPSPQRTPVILVATASSRGKVFAAKHAEAVFLGSSSLDTVRDDIAEIRRRAVDNGRQPDDVKIFNHLRFITGRTRSEAERKAEDYAQYRAREAQFFGIDLSKYSPDFPLRDVEIPDDGSGRDRGRFLGRFIEDWPGPGPATVADLLAKIRKDGGVGPFAVVGTPEEIVDRLEEFVAITDLDGFNVHSNVTPESYTDFVELIVPVLQKRGLLREKYDPAETTFRERLFGAGRKQLSPTHPGTAFRGVYASPAGNSRVS
jgi:alkanesulfonate monooxygenase SsuD/methylene tetrahydromethanopterin reductase-like flavin-dependent oxidoreductase (luciferase family)